MVAAWISIIPLSLIAILHVYWAAGGKLGINAAIPEENGQPLFKPGKLVTLIVAFALFLAAILVAAQAGIVLSGKLGMLPRIATILLAIIFAVRAIGDFRYVGFFKRVKQTRFARLDTLYYSPLCLVLSIAIACTTKLPPL